MTRLSPVIATFAAVLCSVTCIARSPFAKTSPSDPWTPTRVRAFVLHVEAEMEALQKLQYPDGWDKKPTPVVGVCYGDPVGGIIKSNLVMPRVRAIVSGKALPCYVATYLGCTVNGWIGASEQSFEPVGMKPFTRSKVTIVEQTPERVVADIVEAGSEQVFDGVIGNWDDAIGKIVEYTDAALAQYKDVSRYTITRGADGVWRISERKPPFQWECRPN